jgi:raffinose/stachyose/melibiose transport system substrate-binding protein
MLDFVSADHLSVYPMLDNVVQSNIVSAGQKFLPSVLNGTQTVQAALQNLVTTLNQLPASQRGNTFP